MSLGTSSASGGVSMRSEKKKHAKRIAYARVGASSQDEADSLALLSYMEWCLTPEIARLRPAAEGPLFA